MKLLGFASLGRISGQIAALVIASVVALHAIVTASFLLHRPDQPQADHGPAPLATAARLLGAAPAEQRPRLLADLAHVLSGIAILRIVDLRIEMRVSAYQLELTRQVAP